MIQRFVDKFIGMQEEIVDQLEKVELHNYEDLAEMLFKKLSEGEVSGWPSAENIKKTVYGNYDGTIEFKFFDIDRSFTKVRWKTSIWYGSCDYCDTFERYNGHSDPAIRKEGYKAMCLHLVQEMEEIEGSR